MRHALTISLAVRIAAFWLLMLFCWSVWWLHLTGQIRATAWFVGSLLLFLWTFLLVRTTRPLAWLGWLSVLAMILFGLWLPGR